MPQRIDHVIALGADLDALEVTFTRLGFAVVGGGTHPYLGTKNRIILLGDTYLELLAVDDPARVSPILTQRLPAHPGWVGFAVQSDDIAAVTSTMVARGVEVRGPNPGKLVAPNGQARTWQTTTIGSDDFWTAASKRLPFLIQHGSTGEQHRRELAGSDTIPPNPNGAVGIAEVAIAVRSLDESAQRFAQGYGLSPANPSQPEHDASLAARVLTLPLPSGESIMLAEPTGPGLTAQRLEAAGEGLCRVILAVQNLADTTDWLAAEGISTIEATAHIAIPASESGGAPLAFVQAE